MHFRLESGRRGSGAFFGFDLPLFLGFDPARTGKMASHPPASTAVKVSQLPLWGAPSMSCGDGRAMTINAPTCWESGNQEQQIGTVWSQFVLLENGNAERLR